jgi:hypothetical protein
MSEERWLWKATIMSGESVPHVEWAVADNIRQVLDWASGMLDDEDEIIQIKRVSLAEIIPIDEGQSRGEVE